MNEKTDCKKKRINSRSAKGDVKGKRTQNEEVEWKKIQSMH